MKRVINKYLLSLLMLTCYSSWSHSETIDLNYDLVVPFESTSLTNFTVDFGVPGDRIDLQTITFDVTFSTNPWSPGESYGIGWQSTPFARLDTQTRLVRADTYSSTRVISFTTNSLYISDAGLALFKIGVFGGDGAYFDNLKLTAEATISPVPIPNVLFLFTSGLLLISHITRRSTRTRQNAPRPLA